MKYFLFIVAVFSISFASSKSQKAAVISIEKEITSGLLTYIKRAVKDAQKDGANVIFFKMNTPGGRVDETLEIIEFIPTLAETTVAYVSSKALSAGALISLSCKQLVMNENSTIGDCAPLMMTQEGPKMLGEKFQSPLRANFRALAEKNGYPAKLAEGMVTEDIEIIKVSFKDTVKYLTPKECEELNEIEKKNIVDKRTVKEKGRLLTMTAAEALEFGFARAVVKDTTDLFKMYGLESQPPKSYFMTDAERLLIFLNTIAPLLMVIGLICIYLEIKTPGFGFFGIIAIVCFVVLFLTKYIVGLADYIELILFIVGCTLLFIEIFVTPGFGILGASGILLILLAMVLSLQNFVVPRVPWEWKLFKKNIIIVGSIFLLSVPLFVLTLFGTGGILAGSRLVHRQSESSSEGFTPSEDYSWLIGKKGRVLSALRPAGYADFEGRRLNVVSDGEFIEKGAIVKVKEIAGNRIGVEKA